MRTGDDDVAVVIKHLLVGGIVLLRALAAYCSLILVLVLVLFLLLLLLFLLYPFLLSLFLGSAALTLLVTALLRVVERSSIRAFVGLDVRIFGIGTRDREERGVLARGT